MKLNFLHSTAKEAKVLNLIGINRQSSVKTFNISSNLLSFLTKVPHRNAGNLKRAKVPPAQGMDKATPSFIK